MRVALNLDLLVTTAENLTSRQLRSPGLARGRAPRRDGVAEVQMVRSVRVLVKDTPVMLIAADEGALRRLSKLAPVEGDTARCCGWHWPEAA